MPNQARADRHADLMAGVRVPRDRTAEGPPRPAVGVEVLRAFTDAVLGPHRVAPATPDSVPLCSRGLPARCCDIVRAEHELLEMAMPLTFGPRPRPPYREV